MPRKVELDVVAPGSPEAVAERLKAATRWSLQPYRGGPITFGDKPLKGTATHEAINVGLNRRDWWSMMQPTAKARLEPTHGGTRIQGQIGMPDWLTWFLRFTVVAVLPFAIGVASWAALGDGQPLIAAVFTVVALLAGVLGTGAHVAHANQQVDALKEAVLQAAGTTPIGSLQARAGAVERAEALREAAGAGRDPREPER